MTTTFDRVSRFALHHPLDSIPEAVLSHVALLMLDTVGIAAAATPMEAGGIVRDIAFRLYGAGQPQDAARMMFDGRPASLPGAAFAAASQTDNLDAHDGFNPVKGHIGVAVVPALCALAEHLPALRGPDALAALVIGYEVGGRAGMALHASVSDYHTSGAWNALAVAALAARLRGLSPDTLREALGIAEYHGPRSQMMREIAHPTMLHDGSGQGALVGLSAALMAEAGFTGAPALTIEAEDAALFWEDLGSRWIVLEQYIKPYPICRWAHAALDAGLRVRQAPGFAVERIKRIEVASFTAATQLFPGMPPTTSEAQYSLPFALGAALVHGQVGMAEITGSGLTHPDVARLVSRIEMRADPVYEARFPAQRGASVTVWLDDGTRLEATVDEPQGAPGTGFGASEIIAKYHRYANPVLGDARADALKTAVLALPEAESPFTAVATQLYDRV